MEKYLREVLNTKKESKEKVFNSLYDVIQQSIESGTGISPEDLKMAMRYLMPAKPRVKSNLSVMQWLALQVADKKDPRGYLQYIFVKDGYAYATNGHMATKAATPKLKDGYYCPVTLKLVDTKYDLNRYPNVNMVIPNVEKTSPTLFTKVIDATDSEIIANADDLQENANFNKHYLDIISVMDKGHCKYKVLADRNLLAVDYKDIDASSVVMAYRIKK